MGRASILPSLLLALSLIAVTGPAVSAGSGDAIADAERLARTRFHEGVPPEQARRIGDAGAARLAEMLRDQSEAPHHAQIVEVLGMSGHASAWETLQRELADVPQGEVDRATYRKRFALRAALGQLARTDARALAALIEEAGRARAAPPWSSGRHRGERLAAALRRTSVHALAASGRSEARQALRRLRAAAPGPELDRELVEALDELERVRHRRAVGAAEPLGGPRS